jgi:hypothetical protein
MKAWLLSQLSSVWMALFLAPLVTFATQATKRASAWVDMQDAWVKRALAAAYAAAFTALAAAVGTEICIDDAVSCAPALLDWRVIITWAGGLVLHRVIRKER